MFMYTHIYNLFPPPLHTKITLTLFNTEFYFDFLFIFPSFFSPTVIHQYCKPTTIPTSYCVYPWAKGLRIYDGCPCGADVLR